MMLRKTSNALVIFFVRPRKIDSEKSVTRARLKNSSAFRHFICCFPRLVILIFDSTPKGNLGYIDCKARRLGVFVLLYTSVNISCQEPVQNFCHLFDDTRDAMIVIQFVSVFKDGKLEVDFPWAVFAADEKLPFRILTTFFLVKFIYQ